jgi:glucose-1-phosphate thymidylyltransferase
MPTSAGPIRAIVLARGLGSRMRRDDPAAAMTPEQAAAADAGAKGLMPVGRPFLDYALSALADAGVTDVCLVIGPGTEPLRDRYNKDIVPERLRISFAIQPQPLGTADAILAARSFAGGEDFLVVNSDNIYPVPALAALRALPGPGLPVFRGQTLITGGIPADRVRAFAVVRVDADGFLREIVEKPDAAAMAAFGPNPLISMNCWRLSPTIFEACRAIAPSPRGELELPQAVQHAVANLGARLRTVRCDDPVLDLSTRADVIRVAERLRNVRVRL